MPYVFTQAMTNMSRLVQFLTLPNKLKQFYSSEESLETRENIAASFSAGSSRSKN